MHTDKEVYQIIRNWPEALFKMAPLRNPGPGKLESVTIKALQRSLDGLFRPADPNAPLVIVEVQFQNDKFIYTRIAVEAAMIQRDNDLRDIEVLILFASRSLDPGTLPWSSFVHAVYLDEFIADLEETEPDHPLVSVFQPVFEESSEELEKNAAIHYRNIETSPLSEDLRTALLEVFVNWMVERFNDKTKKELNMILDLPDIKDTVCGKEILEEGSRRKAVEVANWMRGKGFSDLEIAEAIGWSEAEVSALLKGE